MEAMEQTFIEKQVIKRQMVEMRKKRKELSEKEEKLSKSHQKDREVLVKKWEEIKQTRLRRFAKEIEFALKQQEEEKDRYSKDNVARQKAFEKQQVQKRKKKFASVFLIFLLFFFFVKKK